MRRSIAFESFFDRASGERKSITDLVGEEITARFIGRKRVVTGLAFSPGVTELAVSGGIKGLSFWAQARKKWINVGVAKSRRILPVFSSNGSFLVSAMKPLLESTGWLVWWDSSTGKPTYYTGTLSTIYAIASSPHAEEIFACGYDNGAVRLWSFKTRQPIGPVIQDEVGNPVRSLTFSPDGLSLAVVNQDGLVSLWSVTDTKELVSFAYLASHISEEKVCYLPVGRRLVGESAGVCSIAYSPDGVWFATGHEDGCIRLWDPVTAHEVEQSLVHSSRDVVAKETLRRVTGLIFSPDSKLLVAVNENGQMFIWRTISDQRDAPHLYLACSFCGRSRHEVRKLIAGPGAYICEYICETCVDLAERVVSSGSAAGTQAGQMHGVLEQDRQMRCSFCYKHRDQVTGLAAMPIEPGGKPSGPAAICQECLSLCSEIIAEEST